MLERQKPMVTELALADALDRLVNQIEELRADADLRVEITTDETDLVKLAFSCTPNVGFPLRREVRDIPGRWSAAPGTRASATMRWFTNTTALVDPAALISWRRPLRSRKAPAGASGRRATAACGPGS